MTCLVFCLAGQSLTLPAPQFSNSIPDSSLPDQEDAASQDEDYYYYADYDPSDVGVMIGGCALNTFMNGRFRAFGKR